MTPDASWFAAIGSATLSGTRPGIDSYYGSTVKAMQAALVVPGVLPVEPALKRMTPSSLEQKLRTPDWL